MLKRIHLMASAFRRKSQRSSAAASMAAAMLFAQNPAAPAPEQPTAVTASPSPDAVPTDVLQLQVMLDRAGFSPGPIDGRMGGNTRKALEAFKKSGGAIDTAATPVTTYTITSDDEVGPYVATVPSDLMAQSKLEKLGYRSIVEALAERFHSTPALLERLNPGAMFRAGDQIQVPAVDPLIVPVETVITPAPESAKRERNRNGDRPAGTSGASDAAPERRTILDRPDVVVTVSKSTSSLTVRDESGRVLLFAPVTTGSERDPLPIGTWKVTGMQFSPKFNYNPDLFWDADPSHSKATIPPGPNNPVGLVWIDLSKEHYGIHGTPEPSAIGRTASHGCVRMTNWDALKLAGLVKPGTRVVFSE